MKISRSIRIIFFLLLAYGLFLRIWNIGEQSMWIDEGFTMNGAYAIADRGVPILESGKLYHNGILYAYAQAAIIKVAGFDATNPIYARGLTALLGILLCVTVYLFCRFALRNERAGMIAATILCFSYWFVSWSRQIRGYMLAAILLVCAFWLLWKYMEKGRVKHVIASFILIGLAGLSQATALAFIPAVCGLVLLHRLERRYKDGVQKHLLWVLLTVDFLAVIFIVATQYSPMRHILGYGSQLKGEIALYFIILLGLIVAVLVFPKRFGRSRELIFLALITTACIVFFAYALQLRYFILPCVVIVCAFGQAIVDGTASLWHKDTRFAFFVAVICAMVICGPRFTIVPATYYWLERGSPQPDFKSAYRIITDRIKPGEVVVSSYTPLNLQYTGQKGYWLKAYLNGGYNTINKLDIQGVDFYTAAPAIRSMADLYTLMREKHGYILMDGMTQAHVAALYKHLSKNPSVERLYEGTQSENSKPVVVFRF